MQLFYLKLENFTIFLSLHQIYDSKQLHVFTCGHFMRQPNGKNLCSTYLFCFNPTFFFFLFCSNISPLINADWVSARYTRGNDLVPQRCMLLVASHSVMRRAGRMIKGFPLNSDAKCCWWSVRGAIGLIIPNKWRGRPVSVRSWFEAKVLWNPPLNENLTSFHVCLCTQWG